jgi:protein-tyrosine phosphatase
MDHVEYDHSVNHIVYPLLDMKSENITKYFTQFYELMEKELARKNVLVHCAAGISRVKLPLYSPLPSLSPT